MRRLIGTNSWKHLAGQSATLAILAFAFAVLFPPAPVHVHAENAAATTEALMKAGVDYIERGLYDRAVAKFSYAIDSGELTAGGRAVAYHHRGVAFQKIGQQQAAIDDYTAAIGSAALPDEVLPKTYYNRGIALANSGQEPEAERDYLEAIRLNPEYAAAYHNLANLERRRGDYKGAIGHYTAAIDNMAGRDSKLPLFGRALSFEQEGKLDLAADDLKRALELDPDFELAQTKLNAISPILAANTSDTPEPTTSPRVVPATLSPFQTAASGQEPGQIIRVASIGGWRTTATRFPQEEEVRPPENVAGEVPSGELVTGSLRPSDQVTEKKPLELATNVAGVSASASEARYRLQLGAFREEAVARQAWGQLSSDARTVLGAAPPAIQKADLGAKGIFYRLQAGAFGQVADAKSACKALEKRKIACFVVESDA